jgi:hypothetical protein
LSLGERKRRSPTDRHAIRMDSQRAAEMQKTFVWGLSGYGGASRDRTDDLIVANDALSQLSYSPTM